MEWQELQKAIEEGRIITLVNGREVRDFLRYALMILESLEDMGLENYSLKLKLPDQVANKIKFEEEK